RKYRWARYSVLNGTFVTSKASRETSGAGRCVTPTSRAPPGACRRSPRLVFPGSRRQQPVSSPSDAHDRTFMGRRGGWLAGGGSRAGGVGGWLGGGGAGAGGGGGWVAGGGGGAGGGRAGRGGGGGWGGGGGGGGAGGGGRRRACWRGGGRCGGWAARRCGSAASDAPRNGPRNAAINYVDTVYMRRHTDDVNSVNMAEGLVSM